MKKDTEKKDCPIDFTEQTPEVNIETAEFTELYQKAFLENDTGVSNEFCQNTSSWD